MSLFDSFFKQKQSIVSLNLERPDSPPDSSKQPVDREPTFEINPALLHAAVPHIKERANAMYEAGTRPDFLYLAIDATQQGPVGCRLDDTVLRSAVLVFTSGFQAIDYLRASKLGGGVHQFPATSLQVYMQNWKESGAGAFALDRCPRCPTCLCIPIKVDMTDEQVSRVWAIHRATRIFQAQRALRSYLALSTKADPTNQAADRRKNREFLELIRDHLDCSVPYLHWMIALEAGLLDEGVRLAAVERLKEFGPLFHDKVTSSSEIGWCEAVVECQMGLLGSFEMFKPELRAAIKRANIDAEDQPSAAPLRVN